MFEAVFEAVFEVLFVEVCCFYNRFWEILALAIFLFLAAASLPAGPALGLVLLGSRSPPLFAMSLLFFGMVFP